MPSLEVESPTAGSARKELLALFFPFLIIVLGAGGVSFFERVCLARCSLDALNSGVAADCAVKFFQLSCVAFAAMAQVFVAGYIGAKEPEKVGVCVWQMIWLSVFSIVLIVPTSQMVGPLFFKGTEHLAAASKYYNILMGGNFLFPLCAALSAFFLAQGKRWVVVWCALGAYGINILLDVVLIFGIPAAIAPMGVFGAAWGALASKCVFALVLFVCFISRHNRDRYCTHHWKVDLAFIGRLVRVCGPRSIGRAFTVLVWTATAYLMIAKGGDYLSIFSIGSTLVLPGSFFAESLFQALSIVIARHMGSKNYPMLWKSLLCSFSFSLLFVGGLMIPLLVLPGYTLSFFFASPPEGSMGLFLKSTVIWVWFWILLYNLNITLLGYILAARDTVYYMIVMGLTWFTSWLPAYYCLYHLGWSPDRFWLILVFDQLAVLLMNIARCRRQLSFRYN